MSFWNDYFKFGLGNKLVNTIGGVKLRNAFGKLLNRYNNAPQTEQQPTQQPTQETIPQIPTLSSGDSMYEGSSPKQDLTGDTGKDIVTTPSQTKEQPSGEGNGNALLNHVVNQKTTPLLNNKDKGKVNLGIVPTLIDPQKRNEYNAKLQNDVMQFLIEAQRFPDLAPQYTNMANSLLGFRSAGQPQTPKFEPKASFTDSKGMLYRYEYNPYKQRYEPAPVTGQDGKQIQTQLPEQKDMSGVTYYPDANGDTYYFDPNTNEHVSVGVKWDNFNAMTPKEKADIQTKMDVASMRSSNKGGRSGHGHGRGNGSNYTPDSESPILHISKGGQEVDISSLPTNIQNLIPAMSQSGKAGKNAKDKFETWMTQNGYDYDWNEDPQFEAEDPYQVSDDPNHPDNNKVDIYKDNSQVDKKDLPDEVKALMQEMNNFKDTKKRIDARKKLSKMNYQLGVYKRGGKAE